MRNSESATQDWTLADLPIGLPARIISLDPGHGRSLANHGLLPGTRVQVEGEAPFGGPRIVLLGGARLAVARPAARAIRVRLEPRELADTAEAGAG